MIATNYLGFMPNDFIDGEGVCVSLWVSGCPFHCKGCHNPEGWNFDSGYLIPEDLDKQLIKAIAANGISRNFSVLGGEPLCEENKEFVEKMVAAVREAYPDIKIFIWSGYTYEELLNRNDAIINHILAMADTLIDGRFELDKRDTSLRLRGSSNQKIIELDKQRVK